MRYPRSIMPRGRDDNLSIFEKEFGAERRKGQGGKYDLIARDPPFVFILESWSKRERSREQFRKLASHFVN